MKLMSRSQATAALMNEFTGFWMTSVTILRRSVPQMPVEVIWKIGRPVAVWMGGSSEVSYRYTAVRAGLVLYSMVSASALRAPVLYGSHDPAGCAVASPV